MRILIYGAGVIGSLMRSYLQKLVMIRVFMPEVKDLVFKEKWTAL